MKSFTKISFLFTIAVLFSFGCEKHQTKASVSRPIKPIDANSLCAFAPSEIEILPLTSFSDDEKLTVYINLLDTYETKIKAPAIAIICSVVIFLTAMEEPIVLVWR